jgi:hypothetical protein
MGTAWKRETTQIIAASTCLLNISDSFIFEIFVYQAQTAPVL